VGRVASRLARRPFQLLRFPSLLLAMTLAAALLALAGAAAPLFLSSAGSAAFASALSRSGGTPALSVADSGQADPVLLAFRNRQLDQAVRPVGGLGPMVLSVTGSAVCAARPGATCGASQPVVRPLARTGAMSHVRVVARGGQTGGVWISDITAGQTGLGPGDSLALSAADRSITVPIAGVFHDFAGEDLSDFWAPLGGLIRGAAGGVDHAPAPLVISDAATIQRIDGALDSSEQVNWEYPIDANGKTLPEAAATSRALQSVVAKLSDPATQLGSAFTNSFQATALPAIVAQASAAQAATTGAVQSIALAGQLLALVGVGSAGVYAARRRRTEVSLLAVRGVGPLRYGLTSSVEAVLPVAIGSGVGLAAAAAMVPLFGPSSSVAASSAQDAATAALLGFVVALVVVGLVGAAAVTREFEGVPGRGAAIAARTPWEAVVLALALASWYEIVTRGSGLSPGPGGEVRIDRLMLLFPVLFLAGAGGLAVRLLQRVAFRRRARADRRSVPAFLAARRLGSAPRAAAVLVTASALSIGILAYAGTVAASVAGTAREKALVQVGSRTAVGVAPGTSAPAGSVATAVLRVIGQQAEPAGTTVDLLAIDPETFARQAFWDPRFATSSLSSLLAALDRSTPGRLPVIVAGGGVPGGSTLSLFEAPVPIQVVGRAGTFPGTRGKRPLLIVREPDLRAAANRAGVSLTGLSVRRELWSNTDPAPLLTELRSANVAAGRVVTATQVESAPSFLALSWTFQFLAALGLLAGLLSLVSLLLYLQARQRTEEVAYVLGRRMGLTRRAHRRSIAFELSGMLLCALAIGGCLAGLAALLVYRRLDPLPALPPGPLLRLPLGLLAATAVALVTAAWGGSWLVQRQADRTNVGELMRLAS
jgi:putative ABC transport system permease protein